MLLQRRVSTADRARHHDFLGQADRALEERRFLSRRVLRGRADAAERDQRKSDRRRRRPSARRSAAPSSAPARAAKEVRDRDQRRRRDHQGHPDAAQPARDAISKARSRCRRTSTSRSRWRKSASTSRCIGAVGEGSRHASTCCSSRRAPRTSSSARPRCRPPGLTAQHRRRRGLRARERLPAADAPDARRRHRPLHRRRRLRREQHHVQRAARTSRSSTRATSPSAASSSPKKSCAPTALSMEEAGRAKKEGGLPAQLPGRSARPVHRRHVASRSAARCSSTSPRAAGREQPEQILICGGCANIPGVADVIASRVGIPAERGDPLGQMKISSPRQGAGSEEGRDRAAHGLRSGTAELRLNAKN